MTTLTKTSARGLALGTTGALVAGLIATTAAPAQADNVDMAPSRTVKGELSGPIGIDHDAAGRVYVASQNNNAIVVHAKDASGPSAPVRRISGAATGLASPRDVALDGNGFLYVSELSGTVRVFAPGATGNVAPVKTFGTGPGTAYGIDVAGGEIYVRKANSYLVYAPSATGSPAPAERTVTGIGSGQSITVSGPRVWVPSGTTLRAYTRSADGGATPLQSIANAFPATETNGIDTDAAGRVYATSLSPATIRVYAPGADGADAPLKVVGGPATGLGWATGLAVLDGGRFAVTDYLNASYSVFGNLFVRAPGKPRAVKVGGTPAAKVRKIGWKAPASNGGARITGYRIVVRKGNATLVKRVVGPTRRSLLVKRSALRRGVNTVFVQAKNSKGYGPAAKRSFRVRK